MTKEGASKMATIMMAYADGKEIECYDGEKWVICNRPGFNQIPADYRIKGESKVKEYVPKYKVGDVVFRYGTTMKYSVEDVANGVYYLRLDLTVLAKEYDKVSVLLINQDTVQENSVKEVTLQEIASKMGIPVESLRIKK